MCNFYYLSLLRRILEMLIRYICAHTVVPECLGILRTFPMESHSKQVLQYCGNKVHQIIQNMILSQGLELKLSLL